MKSSTSMDENLENEEGILLNKISTYFKSGPLINATKEGKERIPP
jgi:hypothetical protein